MKTVDQAIFDKIIMIGTELGYDMYPSLPMEDVPYPFINMVSNHELPQVNKSWIKGKFALSMTVWGNENQRKVISEMTAKMQSACKEFFLDNGLYVALKLGSYQPTIRQEIISQTSTLWRADISFELQVL